MELAQVHRTLRDTFRLHDFRGNQEAIVLALLSGYDVNRRWQEFVLSAASALHSRIHVGGVSTRER